MSSALAEDAVLVYLKARKLTIGLANGPVELTDDGYTRQPVKQWEVHQGTGEAEVTFGPWDDGVQFDRILIINDEGDVLRSVPFKQGLFKMPSGSTYSHTTKITVIDVPA